MFLVMLILSEMIIKRKLLILPMKVTIKKNIQQL